MQDIQIKTTTLLLADVTGENVEHTAYKICKGVAHRFKSGGKTFQIIVIVNRYDTMFWTDKESEYTLHEDFTSLLEYISTK